ncbi:hypothetical protein SLS62_006236 [Diatrype stigma]|uniref:Short-chain oxidoreductase n=1 Tax=Diatrype stigma TaxID=117547 RepID=A0AAN9UPP0_9PEZI
MSATFTASKKQLTWLITGCSSGFGLSLTRIAQAGGHRVIATSRNPSRTPDLVAEVEGKGGKWLKLDVNDLGSRQFVDDLEKSGEEIDVLVNNAGYMLLAPVETTSEEETRATMETLFFGPLRLIQAVIPYMRQRRFGAIINFSSGAALDARGSMGIYAGAKAGIDGITKALAKEVAPFNVRTLTVILGVFNTNLGNAGEFGKAPLPDDYKGSAAEQMMQVIASGKFPFKGDKDKAMKAVYEVVVGEGAGRGREAEGLLPLGSDMTVRVKGVRDALDHSLEVFGEVTNNMNIDE